MFLKLKSVYKCLFVFVILCHLWSGGVEDSSSDQDRAEIWKNIDKACQKLAEQQINS